MCSVQRRRPRWPCSTFQGQARRRYVPREKFPPPCEIYVCGSGRQQLCPVCATDKAAYSSEWWMRVEERRIVCRLLIVQSRFRVGHLDKDKTENTTREWTRGTRHNRLRPVLQYTVLLPVSPRASARLFRMFYDVLPYVANINSVQTKLQTSSTTTTTTTTIALVSQIQSWEVYD